MDVRALFTYGDGRLEWIGRDQAPAWAPSGGQPGKRYLACTVQGEMLYYHHVVWLLHHPALPERVDHRDRNRSNNRIENLRAADHSQNLWNASIYASNTSGFKGVDLHKPTGRYRARLRIRGKEISLGYFATAAEAGAAYQQAARTRYEGFSE